MKKLRLFRLVVLVAVGAACSGDTLTDPAAVARDTGPRLAIVDGDQGGGNPSFKWRRPIVVTDAAITGPFDATLAPTVEICEVVEGVCATTLVTYTTTERTSGSIVEVDVSRELYKVLFKSSKFTLDVARDYRISVKLNGLELGYADIDVVATSAEAGAVDRSAFVPLVNGQSLLIRFRIEQGAFPGLPQAEPDMYTTDVGVTLDKPATDADDLLDNDTLGDPPATLVSFGGGTLGGDETTNPAGSAVPFAGGTLTVNADGSFTLDTPLDAGTFTFHYSLENTAGTSTGLVTITIGMVAPTANPDAYTMQQDGTLSAPDGQPGLLSNDDLGNPAAALVSFGGGHLGGDETTNAAGTTIDPLPEGSGAITVNGDGSFVFTPPTAFIGDYTFGYALENTAGASTAMVTITVNETPSVDANFMWRRPVVLDEIPASAPFDGTLEPEVEICELTAAVCTSTIVTFTTTMRVSGGIVQVDVNRELYKVLFKTYNFSLDVAKNYRIVVHALGQVLGTRDIDLVSNQTEADQVNWDTHTPLINGQALLIRFRIEEGALPGIPRAEPDEYVTEQHTTLARVASDPDDLLDNDVLGDPPATLVSFGGGSLGGDEGSFLAGTSVGLAGGTLTVNADGSFTLETPTDVGTVTFDYRLENTSAMVKATVTITVGLVPGPVDDAYVTEQDVTLTVPDGADDLLDDDDLGVPAGTLTSWGEIDGVGAVTDHAPGVSINVTDKGVLTVNGNGSLTFDPDPAFLGVVTFKYRVTNALGSGDAIVSIEVLPPGPVPPTAAPDAYTAAPDGTLDVPNGQPVLLANDALGNPQATLVSFGGGLLGGDVTSNPAGTTITPLPEGSGSLTVNGDGSVSFIAPTGFVGDYVFEYEIENTAGMSVAAVSITVGAPPEPTDDGYTASGNIEIEVSAANGVLANDGDGLTVTAVQGLAANVGTPTSTDGVGRAGVTGSVTLNADGSFSYDPPPGFVGDDTFTYSVDGGAMATVTVTGSEMVWFIDNSDTGANLGTFNDPFQSVADFTLANAGTGASPDPAPGDVISLASGTGTYSEDDGITLLDDQLLIGEAVTLNSAFTADGNSSAAYQAFAGGTNTAPVIEVTGDNNNGIDLAANNTIRGLTIGNTSVTPGTSSHAMSGSGVGNLVIDVVSITGLGGALDISNGDFGSNVVFDELSSTDAPNRAVRLTGNSGTLEVLSAASAITNSTSQSVRLGAGDVSLIFPGTITNTRHPHHVVELLNTTGGMATFGGTISQSHANGRGIVIDNSATDVMFADVVLGTSALRNGGQSAVLIQNNSTGNVTITNLEVFSTGAGISAVQVLNTGVAGTLTIGNANLDSEGAPAIDITMTAVDINAGMVTSSSSDGAGIRLAGVTGSVAINGVTNVTDPTGAGVDIENATGNLAVDLQSMNIVNAGSHGVRVATVGTGAVCLNLAGNSATAGTDGFVLESAATGLFELQDFVGDGTNPADVEAWIAGKGNAGTTSVSGVFAGAAGVCVP